MCFLGEVCKRVYTLAYKVKAFWVPLVVQVLELDAPLEEELVCKNQLFSRDPALINDPDGSDEFTEMGIVRHGEDVEEKTRALAV